MVPLAGAGLVPQDRVFAFMLGANLGTTITGVLAASANPAAAAVTVAVFHVTFNMIGTLIWYPLRRVPITAAQWYGGLAAGATRYAFLFLILVFFVIPIVGIAITELILAQD
jgi:solute carrier family 34 (sodium-dependent phosphate cotransporter)